MPDVQLYTTDGGDVGYLSEARTARCRGIAVKGRTTPLPDARPRPP